jgi:putative effector of murein hydrolase LrgA (UPF0299 family)
MISGSHHRRTGPVMWGTIGIGFLVLASAAVLSLDPRIAGSVVGILVLVCLVVCGAAFWLDSRASRATAKLAGELRKRSQTS